MNLEQQYQDPRWQRLRLLVFNLHHWECDTCGRTEASIQAHHKFYKMTETSPGRLTRAMVWDYHIDDFKSLCLHCHVQTEIALMELRRVFGCFDHFEVAAFAQDFEKACELESPRMVMHLLLSTLGEIRTNSQKAKAASHQMEAPF